MKIPARLLQCDGSPAVGLEETEPSFKAELLGRGLMQDSLFFSVQPHFYWNSEI